MNMTEWKWSKGEPYYKSALRNEKEIQEKELYEKELYEKELNEKELNDNAIKQSLDGFFTNQSQNQNDSFENYEIYTRNQNSLRREDLDNKISDRELLFHRGTNPFLSSTNYVNDVSIRDNFLKPINTTIDKIQE
jgi:hypothetical protein